MPLPKPIKSIRDTKGYTDKGYTILYNLSSGVSVGVGDRKFISKGYDLLQSKQTFESFKKTVAGQGIDIPRRFAYKLGGRVTGKVMNQFIPDIPGIGGRILRISAGKLSSRVLNKATSILRMDARVDFILNGLKVDNEVKNMARRGMPALEKIQQTMQAIAIANAPNYYALEQMNKKTDLTYNDNYLSAYSLTKYTPEQVDALMSSSDMNLIMDSSEFQNRASEYKIVMSKPDGPEDRVAEKYVMGTYSTEEEAAAAKRAQVARGSKSENMSIVETPSISKVTAEVELELKKALEETQIGATYGFGFLPKTDEAVRQLAAEATEMAMLSQNIPDAEIQERIKAIAGQGYSTLGTAKLSLIILGGLIERYAENPESFKTKGIYNTLRKIRGDVTDLHGLPIKRWNKVRYIQDQGDVIILNDASLSDKALKDFDDMIDPRTKIHNTPGENKDQLRQSKVKRTIRGKHEKNRVLRNKVSKTGEKHPVLETESHTSTFSSNKMRHNYVPSQIQIKTAIHRLDPDTKDPDTLITYTVAFGGKTKASKYADEIRDAFQIEFGGPGTDKQGGLRNRTDNYSFTPSLFMFRALKNTASHFGLDKPSQNLFRLGVNSGNSLIVNKASGVARQSGVEPQDIGITVSGVQSSRRTRTILNELNKRAARTRNSKEAIVKDGFLALDKNKILQSSAKTVDLEIISEVLNDSLFGGRGLTASLNASQATSRAGFEKVFKGFDNYEIANTSSIAKQIQMQDRQMKEGLATYGRLTRKDIELFDEPIKIDPNDPSAVMKYGDDFVSFNQGGARYVLGKRIIRKATPSQALRHGADIDGSGLAPDPRMATPETAVFANVAQLAKGQATIKDIENTIFEAIIKERKSIQAIHTDDLLHARQAAKNIANTFSAEQLFVVSGGKANLAEMQYAKAVGAGAIATAIADFSKFYKIFGQGKLRNTEMVGENILKSLGDTARRQLTEPTFNEFVALLQDEEMLTMLKANFKKVVRDIDNKSNKGATLDSYYVDLRSNFIAHYRNLLENQDASGLSIAMVGGPKKRPFGDTSKHPIYYDNELDLNDPSTVDALDELFSSRKGVGAGVLQSSSGIMNNLNTNYNNLSSKSDRAKALNNILNRVISGSMSMKVATDIAIDERKIQIAIAERINPNNGAFVVQVMNPSEVQKYLTQLLAAETGQADMGRSSKQDQFEDPDLFDGFDF